MFKENQFIPYTNTPQPEGKYLVFAPHPDDEAFAMGGTLVLAAEQGSPIHIIYMTKGELAGDPDVRVAEAATVCEKLNATFEFLDFPDRNIQVTHQSMQEIAELISAQRPDNVFFPSAFEYHPDHRATHCLVWRALQIGGYANDAFTYEVSRQAEANYLVDITTVVEKKRSIMELYSSQLSENNYQDIVLSINKARTYTLPCHIQMAEAFFKVNLLQNPKVAIKESVENYLFDSLPYERPNISILIRTYNRPKLLKRCLESVLKQQDVHRIECVIVNDGGESVEEIVDAYRIHFKACKLINSPFNRGRAASANTALINASGQFINFLDDDDTLEPNHFAVFLNHWRHNNEIEALYRGVRVVDSQGKEEFVYNYSFDMGRLMHANYIPIHAITFSRRFIDMGLRFDESLDYMEDWDFWLQLARLTSFYHVPRITANYHMEGSSAASPHMQTLFDCESHMQKVRDKWRNKWTEVESARIIAFLNQESEKRIKQTIEALSK